MDEGSRTGTASQPSKNRVIKANRKTNAARFNTKQLRGLENALRKDPEADIISLLPSRYSEQLLYFKKPVPRKDQRTFPNHDIRSQLCTNDPCTVVSQPSPELQRLLEHDDDLSESIVSLLEDAEVLYRGVWAGSVMVFRVSEGIVAKVTCDEYTRTEYETLSYLEEHLPSFPVPRSLGFVQLGAYSVLFTTFVAGLDLEKAWPQLDDAQKRSISCQLDALFSELRSLPFPATTPLGGLNGQGCKDARRGTRASSEPIMDASQFEDFIFAGSKTASSSYTSLLRDLMPKPQAKIVFTHGDVRPANIMVSKSEDASWTVAAIIDWDSSGFYPDYWESVKMTNNLAPGDGFNWYKFLPECISPRKYPVQWLVDRVWDRSLDNS